MLQEAVCARSKQSEPSKEHLIYSWILFWTALEPDSAHTTCYSTDLCSYRFDIVPFLTLFLWQHIIYFILEINYFSENRLKCQCFSVVFIDCFVQHFHMFVFCLNKHIKNLSKHSLNKKMKSKVKILIQKVTWECKTLKNKMNLNRKNYV